jgi:DNA-directed RNA polymerase specialized sigma24 family protein
MPDRQSVTQWIEDLKRGDEEAARRLWERYFQKMVQASRRKLQRQPRRSADEEDAAISAFDSLCRGATNGRFPRLDNRDDLWPLLLTLTAQKAVDLTRRETRQRRGGGKVRGDSVFADAGGLDRFANEQPTPEFLALVDEQYSHLMGRLRNETLRSVVQWKMEGHTNEDIAEILGVSVRTVGRKLGMVRMTWAEELKV